MTVMLRQNNEPGSLSIVYIFQYQLKFISGLGNEENSLSDKQSCIKLVTFKTVFTENELPAIMKHIKVKYMW